MANMGYIRFENTFSDLEDCYEALHNAELKDMSESERIYAKKLIKLCKDVFEDFKDELITNIN